MGIRVKLLLITIAVTVFAMAPLPALADYHYASHTGTNTPPYTSWATAADSIQKAIDAATAGDTVYVGAGVWENQPLNLWEGLALIGAGMDSTILRRNELMIWQITTYSNTLILGFTLENPVDGSKGIFCSYPSTNINITNNKFHNIYMGILNPNGIISNNIFDNARESIDGSVIPCSVRVFNNTFCNANGARSIIAIDGKWYVTNNLFYYNPTTTDRLILLGMHHEGVDTAYFANNLLYRNYEFEHLTHNELIISTVYCYYENNTIIGFDDASRFIAIYSGFDGQGDTISIKNNIINGFLSAVCYFGESLGVRLYYNNLRNNSRIVEPGSAGYFDSTIGNQYIDPMFADTTSFQLQAFSPCIDAGDPNILDVDGTRSDIGCYGGPLGHSYIYQDLPPAIPESLRVDIGDDSLLIRWHYNTETDFNRYYFYKDTILGFTPSISTLIAQPETSLYIDRDFDRQHNYYYRISAIDNQGHLSDYSAELGVRFIGIDNTGNPLLPSVTEIKSTYPNPFNSMITISYYLADIGYQPAEVKLYIYDIGGRLVRKLVDCRQNPGRYVVTWDGRTDGGEQLSSGVYFSRLSVSGIELQKPRKITLMK
jgi:hypothetical protein